MPDKLLCHYPGSLLFFYQGGAEAIVNAVAHRDYTSSGSIQVMLFSDRLEVWNPGALPPSLTLEKLRSAQGSVPGNPLLAELMYLTRYIEWMGTGIGDMILRCREAGLPEPEFAVTDGFQTVIRRVQAREPGEETREEDPCPDQSGSVCHHARPGKGNRDHPTGNRMADPKAQAG